MNRRTILSLAKNGFGGLALMQLLGPTMSCSRNEEKGTSVFGNLDLGIIPDYPAKAKSIIFLYMDGGISQVDSFDYKPRLEKENGQNPYDKFKVDATQFNNIGKILKSPWGFKQYGESGIWVSDLFPHIATCVDDIAVIKSMVSNFPEHTNANYFLHTGHGLQGRPSMGAWVNYGLGSTNDNLPGYVVLDGGLIPPGGLDNFNSGFLPARYQASILKAADPALPNINPLEATPDQQKTKLDLVNRMDQSLLGKLGHQDDVEAAIRNYELAFQMQSSVPELTELEGESMLIQKMYGMHDPDPHTRGMLPNALRPDAS